MGIFNFFKNLSLSKNDKLIARWEKEHMEIAQCGIEAQDAQIKGDSKKAKKNIKKMYELAIKHIKDEDDTFHHLKINSSKNDPKYNDIMQSIEEFEESFAPIKKALIQFLVIYAADRKLLDDEFKTKLSTIMGVLEERIDWEEKNLYKLLKD